MPHNASNYSITDSFRAGFVSRSNSVEAISDEQDGLLSAAIGLVETRIRQKLPQTIGLEPDDQAFTLDDLPHGLAEAIYEVAVVMDYGRGDVTGQTNLVTPIAAALMHPFVACLEVFPDEEAE